MQDLWRKTAELSREHPILWLPLVCVGLIDISLQWFKKAGTSAIVHSLTTGHSVLGGEVPTSNVNSTILAKVALLSGPLTWGSIFVQIFVYTAAFVLTAAWVAMILRGEEPSPASAQPTLMRSFRSSLFFSAKLFGLQISAAILVVLPGTYLFKVLLQFHGFSFLGFGTCEAFVGSAGIAWLLVPAGIRLIQSQHTGSLHSEAVRKGRLFALLVVLASNAFSYLALKWEGSLIAAHSVSPLFRKLAIHPAMVLLVAFPYMLLWIALSLLSSEEAEMVEIPSPS